MTECIRRRKVTDEFLIGFVQVPEVAVEASGGRFKRPMAVFLSRLELNDALLWSTFFFCTLNCSMMTPMKRLRVKNEPNTMNRTKYKYMYALFS